MVERLGAPSEKPEHPLTPYTFTGRLLGQPRHIFCGGCGYGVVAQAVTRVFAEEKLDVTKYPFLTGIGCYSALPSVLPGHCTMCLHGRPIAVATGMKLANPELKPIVFSGDGDLLAIGVGHFVHACRRNVDMVVIMFHNNVYGMTGGQIAPTSYTGQRATTAPYGFVEEPIECIELAITSGATFVARWSIAHIPQFMRTFKKALKHKGTSVIDILSTCPTYFGRKNRLPKPIDVFRWIKNLTVPISKAKEMSEDELRGKYLVGEFMEKERAELSEVYQQLIRIAQGNSNTKK
jgi:2-oxoglutarate ferredoxin oxidoreductase subunit beta